MTVSGSSDIANNEASGSVSFALIETTYIVNANTVTIGNGGHATFDWGTKVIPVPLNRIKFITWNHSLHSSGSHISYYKKYTGATLSWEQWSTTGCHVSYTYLTPNSSDNSINVYTDASEACSKGTWYNVGFTIKHNYNHLSD